ncbi:hypothetical protein CHS0354_033861, partial [Potamilus streckersoni]
QMCKKHERLAGGSPLHFKVLNGTRHYDVMYLVPLLPEATICMASSTVLFTVT